MTRLLLPLLVPCLLLVAARNGDVPEVTVHDQKPDYWARWDEYRGVLDSLMAPYDSLPGLRIVRGCVLPESIRKDNLRSILRAVKASRRGNDTLVVRWGSMKGDAFCPREHLVIRGTDMLLVFDGRWDSHNFPTPHPKQTTEHIDSLVLVKKVDQGPSRPPKLSRNYDSIEHHESILIERCPNGGIYPLWLTW